MVKKHGLSKHPLYSTWLGMNSRCRNENAYGYKHYGGRGIRVCNRWESNFENFLEDMGNKPTQKHSIDRIDPDGNYEPSNCRWATNKEQANNKRNTFKVKKVVLNTRISYKTFLRIDEYAKRTGESKASITEKALEAYLNKEEK